MLELAVEEVSPRALLGEDLGLGGFGVEMSARAELSFYFRLGEGGRGRNIIS